MSLRPLTKPDLSLVRSWRNAPEVRRNMFSSHEISDSEHLAWFARMEKEPQSRWFLYENKPGIPEGVVYFTQISETTKNAFWGFYLASDASTGTGTKLAMDALDLAFFEIGVHKLNAEALSTNEISLRFHEKLGFKREGLFRDFHFANDQYCDAIRFGLLAKEWQAHRASIKERLLLLDQLQATNAGGGYTILILTDKDSWLLSYLDDLAEEWEASGHTCQIANKETEINKANGAKFCFCLGFGQIVSDEFRSSFKNTLVVHESELPKGRGWAPMTWQILEGKKQIPVTLLEAENAVDSGQVYLQEYIELKGTELNPDWRNLQGKATQRLCREWINTYPAVLEKATKQLGEPSFYGRRNKKDSVLNPEKSINEQFNLLRVVDNRRYPAFFKVRGETFRLTIEKEVN